MDRKKSTPRKTDLNKQADKEGQGQLIERLKLATHAAQMGIWDWDIQKDQLIWDEQMYRLYGLKPDAFGGAYEARLNGVHPDDRASSNEISQMAVRGEKEYDTEFRVIWPDGSIHWLKANGQVVRDQEGNPIRMVGVNYDITAIRETTEQVRKSDAQLRALVTSLDDIVFEVDEHGTYLNVWTGDEARLFRPREEVIGKRFNDVFGEEASRPFFEYLERTLNSNSPQTLEYPVEINGGKHWYAAHYNIIHAQADMPRSVSILVRDITERRRLEERLRESEQKYTMLFEKSTVPTAVLKLPEVVIADVNEACQKLTGFTRQEMLGKTSVELGLARKADRQEVISRFEHQGVLTGNETRLFTKSGEERVVVTNTIPVEIGGQMYVITTMQDITERKQAEGALHEREQKLNTLLNLLPVGISILDQDRKVTYVNKALEKILEITPEGLSRGEYRNRQYLRADGSEKPMEEFASTRAFNERIEVHDVVTGVVKEDTQTIWTSVSAVPVDFPDWKVVLVTSDITERKQAEDALKESEARFSKVFFTNPVSQSIISLVTGQTREVNNACCRLYEYSREELIGTSPENLDLWVNPADQLGVLEELQRTGRLLPREIMIRPKSGEIRTILFSIEQISWKGEPCLISSSVDISERKQAEKKLRENEVLLRQVLESIPDSTFALDRNYRFLIGNQRHQQALIASGGHPFQSGEQMLSPDYPAEVLEFWRTAYDRTFTGETFSLENSWMDNTGQLHIHENRFSPLCDAAGTIIGALVIAHDITERNQAELALRKSEEKYRELINGMNDTIWVIDFDTSILDVNTVATTVLGYTREEMLRMKVADIDHNIKPEHIQHLANSMPINSSQVFESKHTTKDGRDIPVEISSSLVTYMGKTAIMSIARDISYRKQAEQALKDSENRLKSMLETAMDAIVSADQDQRIVLFNAAAERMFGIPSKDALGQTISRFMPDRFHDYHRQQMMGLTPEIVRQIPANKVFSIRGLRANGEEFPAESTISYVESNGEKLFTAILRDTTERQKADQALRESEGRLRKILQTTSDGFWLVDSNRRFLDINEAYCTMSGYTRQELLQLTISDVEALEDISETDGRIRRIMNEGRDLFETRHRRKDGTIFDVEVSVNLLDEEIGLMVCFCRDITERKRAQEELHESKARFVTIFENSPNAIGIARLSDNKLIEVNPAFLELFEYAREEIIGHTSAEMGLWVIQEDRQKLVQKLQKEGLLRSFETIFRNKRGDEIPVLLSAEIIEIDHEPCLLILATDITGQKKNEEALRESEEKYRSLVEASDALVVMMDEDGRLHYLNEKAAHIQGLIAKDVLGKTLHELLPKEIADLNLERVQQVISKNQRLLVESPVNGGATWYRVSIQPIHDVNGKAVKVLLSAVDISELKAAQQNLQELNSTLEARVEERTAEVLDLYNNAPNGYHSLDANGKIIMINQTELNWLGYTREEVVGIKSLQELLTQSSQKSFAENFPRFKTQGWLSNLTLEMIRKDGSTFPVLVNATAIQDEHGKFIMSRSTLVDITQRKQSEDALRESQARLQYFFDTASDLIQSMDENGKYQYVNNAWCQTLGYTAEEAMHLSMLDVIDESHHEHCRSLLNLLVTNQQPQQLEVLFKTKSGDTVIVEGSVGSRKDINGHLATNGIFRNITERKKAETALRESRDELGFANAALEKASRMKDEFLASMSHELRTPLTGILGLTESLQLNTYGHLNEKQSIALKNIEASGRHLLELINDILDLSKIESSKFDIYPEMISIEETCHASLAFVKEQATKKSILLEYQNAKDAKSVFADSRRLKQILVNLLSNAVKFTPDKGKVTLSVSTDPAKGQIHFAVADTGIGIAKEDLGRLFTPFTQVDSRLNRQYEGTGLGLALVLRLTEMHGGNVQVETEPGQGSCFTVSLPWQSQVMPPVDTNQPHADLSARSEPNTRGVILLAEDNASNIETIGDYLQFKGYTLVFALTGVEALLKAKESNPNLILMDIQMPVMDGLETMRRLRADPRFTSTPIIALTALAMAGDRERCMEAGASEYLSKPVSLKELTEKVEKLLQP